MNDMLVAIRSFRATEGAGSYPVRAGVTHVDPESELARRYPDDFAADDGRIAGEGSWSTRSESSPTAPKSRSWAEEGLRQEDEAERFWREAGKWLSPALREYDAKLARERRENAQGEAAFEAVQRSRAEDVVDGELY